MSVTFERLREFIATALNNKLGMPEADAVKFTPNVDCVQCRAIGDDRTWIDWVSFAVAAPSNRPAIRRTITVTKFSGRRSPVRTTPCQPSSKLWNSH